MRHLYEDGYTPVYLPFAAALKEEADKAGYGKAEDPEGYRKYCQNWGAKMREQNQDYWVERWTEQYEKHLLKETSGERESETVILIDDCRYVNETEAIKHRGGKTIFVAAGDRTLFDEDGAWRKHESEALANLIEKTIKHRPNALTPFCHLFWNNRSLEELEENLVFAYEDWLEEVPCTCELCKSRRENRDPDMDAVFKEIKQILLEENIDPSEIFDADADDSDP
tara:strand:- start:39768 stop:40442 length:675 start_codon:yes stop_codon:yes gene_type:complete